MAYFDAAPALKAKAIKKAREFTDEEPPPPELVALWRFAFIDVRYYDQFIFGGWQAGLQGLREYNWIDRDRPHLKEELMRMFPLTLFRDWDEWKVAFARAYQRGRFCRRPRGRALVRWDGQSLRPVSAGRVGK